MSKENATITYAGLKFVVSGEYTPPEAGVMYHPDGSGTPPSGSEMEIEEIIWAKEMDGSHAVDVDVTELLESISDSVLMDMESLACDAVDEGYYEED